MSKLPARQKARALLEEHVKDEYQRKHANMVAECLKSYARKYNEDEDLWYLTGLLHDLDYYEYPEDHPDKSLEWFEQWEYPDELIHAVASHYWKKTGELPQTKLAAALIAVDELTGLLYAYSLMRPGKWEGMKAKSVKKKFKDKSFAAKIDREEIIYGIQKLGVDFDEHTAFMIDVLSRL